MEPMQFDTYNKGQLMAALACVADSRAAAVIRAHHANGVTTYRFRELPQYKDDERNLYTLEERNAFLRGAMNKLRRTPADAFAPAQQRELLRAAS